MKKLFGILICFWLLFTFLPNAAAQSSNNKLDQVELVKQFLGTSVAEVGKDSVLQMKGVSLGDGVYFHGEWKSDGKPYYHAHAVVGFTDDKETIILNAVWSNGETVQEIGRFVSEEKLVLERFTPEHPTHAIGLSEYDFSTPGKIIWRWYGRGKAVTWEPIWKYEMAYNRVME